MLMVLEVTRNELEKLIKKHNIDIPKLDIKGFCPENVRITDQQTTKYTKLTKQRSF